MSGLYGNPCVPEQSSSTSKRYEKASHRALADMLGRIGTLGKGANLQGNSLGNQLRRKDILPPFRMFYSLAPTSTRCVSQRRPSSVSQNQDARWLLRRSMARVRRCTLL